MGVHNSFPGLCNSELLEDYVLRHDQNRPRRRLLGDRAPKGLTRSQPRHSDSDWPGY